MSDFTAIDGKKITDEQLAAWEQDYAQGTFPEGERNLSQVIHGSPRSLSSGKMQPSRRKIIERAIHSAQLSGGSLSPQFLCDANRYIDGSLSLDEMLQRALDRARGTADANKSAEHPCSQTP